MNTRLVAVTSIVLALLLSASATLTASPVQQEDEAALLRAAAEGRVDVVRTLLEQGLDVNSRDEDGWTPLLIAAQGGHTEVVNLLVEHGADIEAQDECCTPLMYAAQSGHTEVVNLLLERGADVNAKNKYGQTSLMIAARGGHTEVVNLLREHGADLGEQDHGDVEYLPPPSSDASRLGDRPVFTPYTVRPEINDRTRAWEILLRNYPKELQDAGIGGTVSVWVFIDTNGRVQNAVVHESSGNEELDAAALAAAREIEFTPARNMDKVVPVWVSFPITFEVPGAPEAGPLPEEDAELSRFCDQPVSTPYTVRPEIKDRTRAVRLVMRNYPKELQDAGISGMVYVWVCIDTNGRVRNALVKESSGHEALDAAALASAREFEFTPARNNDEVVPVWIHFLILFEVPR